MHRLRVCEPECPADAIKPDTEPGLEKWLEVNTEYAKTWPNITQKKELPPDAKDFEGMEGKFENIFLPLPVPATDATVRLRLEKAGFPLCRLNPNSGEMAKNGTPNALKWRKSLIFAENVLYWAHYKPNPAMRILWRKRFP